MTATSVGGIITAGLLALYLPAWADAAYGKTVEHAEVVRIEVRPIGRSKACTTIETVSQGASVVKRNPEYVVTWRSKKPPPGQPTRFTAYSCDRYVKGVQHSVIRGPHHRVTRVNWLNANIYRVVLLCLLVGAVSAGIVYVAAPRGPRITDPTI